MVFRPNSGVTYSRLKFVVDNLNVDIVNQVKYKGCIFSDNFSDISLPLKDVLKVSRRVLGFY